MFKVIQISDTHLYAGVNECYREQNQYENLRMVINKIKQEESADFVLMTGDASNDYSEQSYQHLYDLIAPLNIPCYFINGNHDDKAMMEQVLSSAPFCSEKIIVKERWCFVLLDSVNPGKVTGIISDEQQDFLAQALKRYRDYSIVVVLHHHPISVHGFMDQYILKDGERFLESINGSNVKLVLFGHIHQVFKEMHNNIVLQSAPATAYQLVPRTKSSQVDSLGPGYQVFEFDGGGFCSTIKRVS